jgi:hypothetical protein
MEEVHVHHSVREFVENAEKEEKKKRMLKHELVLFVAVGTFILGAVMGSTRVTGFAVGFPLSELIIPVSFIVISLALALLWLDLRKK